MGTVNPSIIYAKLNSMKLVRMTRRDRTIRCTEVLIRNNCDIRTHNPSNSLGLAYRLGTEKRQHPITITKTYFLQLHTK